MPCWWGAIEQDLAAAELAAAGLARRAGGGSTRGTGGPHANPRAGPTRSVFKPQRAEPPTRPPGGARSFLRRERSSDDRRGAYAGADSPPGVTGAGTRWASRLPAGRSSRTSSPTWATKWTRCASHWSACPIRAPGHLPEDAASPARAAGTGELSRPDLTLFQGRHCQPRVLELFPVELRRLTLARTRRSPGHCCGWCRRSGIPGPG